MKATDEELEWLLNQLAEVRARGLAEGVSPQLDPNECERDTWEMWRANAPGRIRGVIEQMIVARRLPNLPEK